MYTVPVRLRLWSPGCSSCSDADLGTSASTRCVQHCRQRHWTTPFPTSQHARSASLEAFRVRESECASMGRLRKRVSWRSEIVLLILRSLFMQKGNAHSLFVGRLVHSAFRGVCFFPAGSASLFNVRPRDFGALAVAPARRSTVLSAPHFFLFRALLVHRILRVLPSRNSEDPMPQQYIVTFMDLR